MIASIRHKGLRLFYEKGDASKLPATQLRKITSILSFLEIATSPQEMAQPGFGFHGLSGELQDFYAVKVTANYRIIFRFEGENAVDVDYLDYH